MMNELFFLGTHFTLFFPPPDWSGGGGPTKTRLPRVIHHYDLVLLLVLNARWRPKANRFEKRAAKCTFL